MNQTLNWTNPVNYKVKWPDPLPHMTNTQNPVNFPKTTATLEFPPLERVEQTKQSKQQYLLDKLQEESAEVIQAISKVRRFGAHNHHPDRRETNLQELIGELEDWLAIVAALEHTQYFDLTNNKTNIQQKAQALIRS